MAITLQPKIEEQLREKAQREGQDVNEVANALIQTALERETEEQAEVVEGIRRGLEDSDAGRVLPAEEVYARVRASHGIA